MFENIFKKESSAENTAPDAHDLPPEASAQGSAALSSVETQDWFNRINAAVAAVDDVTLLQLAHDAPTVLLKLASIEALTLEASFKQAMHDFREHDKRLYRAAKLRWETASGKRVAAEEADALISSAQALLVMDAAPVNRVVDLDRAWAALNHALVDPATHTEFSALSAQLGERLRVRGEQAQNVARWLGMVDQSMQQLQETLPGVARGETLPAEAQPLALMLLELVQGVPDSGNARCVEKVESANRLLALASSAVQRATFLQALPAPGHASDIEESVEDTAAREKQIIEQWRAFPEISDAGVGEWHTTLAARFAEWRNAALHEREVGQAALSAEERETRREQNKQRLLAIQHDVEAAEKAHADGHIADLTRLLIAIDYAVKRGAVNAALTQRIEVLRAEQRRLQDWQRWGGRQSREQVVAQAQTLAEAATGKVAIKTHAEAIDKLRERWKALDKLGAASNQVMWLNFDAAMKKAHAPVAAHLEKLKAERNENLTKREQIVTGLTQAAARHFSAPAENAAAPAADWRAVTHALEEAQAHWRKLGPLEHTVPRKAQKGDNAIVMRYAAALRALEAPLQGAYDEARARRDALITEATALQSSATARDVVDKIKKIQALWQTVAKAMPLPRRDENALWTRFKTATDAIFTTRDAARSAQESARNAKQQARIDIIERVATLTQLANAADIKRTLAENDSAWRAAPDTRDLPKPQAAKLEARYRAARDAASKRISELAVHAEQSRYDALIAAITLCHERETIEGMETTALQSRWEGLADLPVPWRAVLEVRFQGQSQEQSQVSAPIAGKKHDKKLPETLQDKLLNLEIGCGIDSPTAFQSARQQLKIRALKEAMEGRKNTPTTPVDIERWLLEAAASSRPDEDSRERLSKIIAAVRRRPSR